MCHDVLRHDCDYNARYMFVEDSVAYNDFENVFVDMVSSFNITD